VVAGCHSNLVNPYLHPRVPVPVTCAGFKNPCCSLIRPPDHCPDPGEDDEASVSFCTALITGCNFLKGYDLFARGLWTYSIILSGEDCEDCIPPKKLVNMLQQHWKLLMKGGSGGISSLLLEMNICLEIKSELHQKEFKLLAQKNKWLQHIDYINLPSHSLLMKDNLYQIITNEHSQSKTLVYQQLLQTLGETGSAPNLQRLR